MISACETNEMVGVKVAWYWHEMEFTTMVWEWWMCMDLPGKWKRRNNKELVWYV